MFATPICNTYCVDNLTADVEKFSIFPQTNNEIETNDCTKQIDNTPVRPQASQKRRILGKLREVSVPVTPKLWHENNKYKTNVLYLLEVMDQFKSSLKSGLKITHLYLMIGPTSVSPKELYVIDINGVAMETNQEIANGQNYKKYLMQIMQVLFLNPVLTDMTAALSPTKCYIMFSATNSLTENQSLFFLPKVGYRLPKRGLRFDLVLKTCNESLCTEPGNYFMAPKPFKSCKSGAVHKVPNVPNRSSGDLLDSIKF